MDPQCKECIKMILDIEAEFFNIEEHDRMTRERHGDALLKPVVIEGHVISEDMIPNTRQMLLKLFSDPKVRAEFPNQNPIFV
jgi:hypothetical protein